MYLKHHGHDYDPLEDEVHYSDYFHDPSTPSTSTQLLDDSMPHGPYEEVFDYDPYQDYSVVNRCARA